MYLVRKITGLTMMIAVIFISCSREKQSWLPQATGTPFDLLIVAEDSVWNAPSGVVLKGILTQPIAGLPQNETQFSVSRISKNDFTGMWRLIRNIIIVEKSDTTRIWYAKDKWAANQFVVTVGISHAAELLNLLHEQSEAIKQLFVAQETMRMQQKMVQQPSVLSDTLYKYMNVHMYIPEKFVPVKQTPLFCRYVSDTRAERKEILVYTIPRSDSGNLSWEQWRMYRDSVMRNELSGTTREMYVCTDTLRKIPLRHSRLNHVESWEMRGLWYMKNDMMGGPFISRAVYDDKNRRYVVAEMLNYAPAKKKRLWVNESLAILQTLKMK